ncbi:MAG: hypothetical protein AAFX94_08130, partial [Myxococcota bacterium]
LEHIGRKGRTTLQGDPRFAELVGFEPFDALIDRAREIQAGPIGRLMIRLERLERSAQETVDALQNLAELLTLVARVATSFLFPLVSFVLLGLLSTAGAGQLSALGRPWTLLVGFGIASAVWISGTQRLTAGADSGLETVLLGCGVVLGAWLVLMLLMVLLNLVRRRYRVDPWAPSQRDLTLAMIGDVEHLADAFDRGDVEEGELRAATKRLKERLGGRPRERAIGDESAVEPADEKKAEPASQESEA